MRRAAVVAIVLLLVACGQPTPTQQAPIQQPTIAAAEPTLTAKERADMQTVATRAASMTKAAQDLQQLGQELRASVAWQVKVKTAAQIITGGQKAIAPIALPASYAPLAKRIKETTENCAKPAEVLLAIDATAIKPADVAAQRDALGRWCVTEMERMRFQVESL